MTETYTKVCKTCTLPRSLSLFHKHPTTHDRLQQSCKSCCKKASRAYYEKNKDSIRLKAQKKNAQPTLTPHQRVIMAFVHSTVWWERVEIMHYEKGVTKFYFIGPQIGVNICTDEVRLNTDEGLSTLISARYKDTIAMREEEATYAQETK